MYNLEKFVVEIARGVPLREQECQQFNDDQVNQGNIEWKNVWCQRIKDCAKPTKKKLR